MSSVIWVLGIDPGMKKTGVAVGQSLTGTAQPLAIVHTPLAELGAEAFASYVAQWRTNAIVVGLPELADGTEHPLLRGIEALIERLRTHFHLPVYTHSEFLSSHAARALNPERKQIDDLAAALILESWLNTQQGKG